MSKKDLDPIEATRIVALWNVTRQSGKEDPEYLYREMCRWYSREFNYKLHEVDDIDVETVAMNFYEHHYGEMTPEQRDEEIKKLVLTEEEHEAAEAADDKFLADAIREAAEQANALRSTATALKDAVAGLKAEPKAIEELKQAAKEPDIEMKFVSEEEMDEMGDWDLLGNPPDKK